MYDIPMPFSRLYNRETVVQLLLCSFLAAAVLWRGGKSIDATWILSGVTFAVVLLSTLSAHSRKGVPWVLWFPSIGMMLWIMLSYLNSTTANYGLDEVLRTSSFILLFLWAIRFTQREEQRFLQSGITNFVRVLSIVTLVACAIGVIVYVFQPVNRFVGTFFDARFHTDYWPNAWANYLLLVWPIVYYWVLSDWKQEATRAQRTASFAARGFVLAFILSSVFLSFSRGAIIAFSGQLLLWAGITYIQMKQRGVWVKIIAALIGVTFMAGLLFQFANTLRADMHEVLSVEQKVTFSASEGTSSVSERSAFWQQAFSLANQKPAFGWGPYSFRFVQPHLQHGVLATSDHPHNIFLKMAAENGWPMAFLFLLVLLLIFLRSIDAELRQERTLAPLGTILLVSIAGVISHSLIDYNLQFVGIALPFWLMLGFLAGHTVKPSDATVPLPLTRTVEMCFATILFCVALYEGAFLVTSSIGRHAEAAGETRQTLVWYERSVNEHFSRDLHLSRTNIHIQNQEFTTAERTLRDYFSQNKQDARAWKLQAEIYAGMNQYAKAIEAYETAYSYGKYNDIGITLGLVQSYAQNNQSNVIQARKQEFDELIKQYSNAILLNTHFITLSPNVEQFIELCELFAELYSDEAPVYIVYAAKADDHASVERQRLTARPPGFLW